MHRIKYNISVIRRSLEDHCNDKPACTYCCGALAALNDLERILKENDA